MIQIGEVDDNPQTQQVASDENGFDPFSTFPEVGGADGSADPFDEQNSAPGGNSQTEEDAPILSFVGGESNRPATLYDLATGRARLSGAGVPAQSLSPQAQAVQSFFTRGNQRQPPSTPVTSNAPATATPSRQSLERIAAPAMVAHPSTLQKKRSVSPSTVGPQMGGKGARDVLQHNWVGSIQNPGDVKPKTRSVADDLIPESESVQNQALRNLDISKGEQTLRAVGSVAMNATNALLLNVPSQIIPETYQKAQEGLTTGIPTYDEATQITGNVLGTLGGFKALEAGLEKGLPRVAEALTPAEKSGLLFGAQSTPENVIKAAKGDITPEQAIGNIATSYLEGKGFHAAGEFAKMGGTAEASERALVSGALQGTVATAGAATHAAIEGRQPTGTELAQAGAFGLAFGTVPEVPGAVKNARVNRAQAKAADADLREQAKTVATGDLGDHVVRAIAGHESGGDYQAINRTSGHDALGKYQIMDFNLPSWSKKYLGRVVSKEDFLNSPELQDELAGKLIKDNFEKNLRKTGGDVEQAIRETAFDHYGDMQARRKGDLSRLDLVPKNSRGKVTGPSPNVFADDIVSRVKGLNRAGRGDESIGDTTPLPALSEHGAQMLDERTGTVYANPATPRPLAESDVIPPATFKLDLQPVARAGAREADTEPNIPPMHEAGASEPDVWFNQQPQRTSDVLPATDRPWWEGGGIAEERAVPTANASEPVRVTDTGAADAELNDQGAANDQGATDAITRRIDTSSDLSEHQNVDGRVSRDGQDRTNNSEERAPRPTDRSGDRGVESGSPEQAYSATEASRSDNAPERDANLFEPTAGVSTEGAVSEPETRRPAEQGGLSPVEPSGATLVEEPRVRGEAKANDLSLQPVRVSPHDIDLEPERFQYKSGVDNQGVTDQFKETKRFNEALAGSVMLWRDPMDTRLKAVNGHHRVELGQRTNAEAMNGVVLPSALSAEEARAVGALANIAEGRGTAVDAAKVFREKSYTPNDLENYGIKLTDKLASDALALSKLDDAYFQRVSNGQIPQAHGVLVGSRISDRRLQQQAFQTIDALPERQKTEGTVREIVDAIADAPVSVAQEESLFGTNETTKSLGIQKVLMKRDIRERFTRDKSLYGKVSTDKNATELERGGNKIDVENSRRIAEESAQNIQIFDALKNTPELNGLFNVAVQDLEAKAAPKKVIADKLFEDVNRKLKEYAKAMSRGATPVADPDQSALFMQVVPGANVLLRDLANVVRKEVLPVLRSMKSGAVEAGRSIQAGAAPTTRGEAARLMKGIMRENLADFARKSDVLHEAFKKIADTMGKLPTSVKLEFIDRMEHGIAQSTPELEVVAQALRDLRDDRIRQVQGLGTGKLRDLIENYFPHIWKDPKRAKDVMNGTGRRPFEGDKSFLRKREIAYIKDGLAKGLELVTDNPVELMLLKVHQMDKYVMAHRVLGEAKKVGLATFYHVSSKPDPAAGLAKIDDSIGTVYGSPTIGLSEYTDQKVTDAMKAVIDRLGIRHDRKFEAGRNKLGYAMRTGDHIVTQFATGEEVVAHELGHALDFKYGLWDHFKQADAKLAKPGRKTGPIARELRALADERMDGGHGQKYVRNRYEKMAVILQAYVHAPKLMERVAPETLRAFRSFIADHPELKELSTIEPDLHLTPQYNSASVDGMVTKGYWFMPEPAARLINNYLSPGLRYKSSAFRGYLSLANHMNQFQLGWSFFHLGFVNVDAITSRVALGVYQGAHGAVKEGLKNIATAPAASFINFHEGNALMKEWLKPGSQGKVYADMVDAIVRGGGRAQMDSFYHTNARERMKAAWRDSTGPIEKVLRAGMRLPGAATELVSMPILEKLVPRMKLGAFAQMARFELQRLGPDAGLAEQREALAKAWDSIDNRLGQLVYDNLFWNRTTKDLAMASVRSVGWNLGTFRELGGGIIDVGRFAKDAVTKGKQADFTHRMSYVVALPTVAGLMGAVTQYLITGQGPDDLKDYFFPRDGGTDENGNPTRVSLPSYMKDVYAYYNDVHSFFTVGGNPLRTVMAKLHPVIALTAEMLENKDFYGTQIRNPDDPLVEQVKDVASHLTAGFTPFAVRGIARNVQLEGFSIKALAPEIGIVPSPKDLNETNAERLAASYVQEQMPRGARTKEAAASGATRKEIMRQYRLGNTARARELEREALKDRTLTPAQVKDARRDSRLTPLMVKVKSLKIDKAMNVYEAADPQDRTLLWPVIVQKFRNLKPDNTSPEDRQLYRDRLQQIRSLERANPARTARRTIVPDVVFAQ